MQYDVTGFTHLLNNLEMEESYKNLNKDVILSF